MLSSLPSLPVVRLPFLDRKQWFDSLVLATVAVLYLFAGVSLATMETSDGRAVARAIAPVTSEVPKTPPPEPEPLSFRDLAPLDALAFNASIPVSSEPNPAARPFVLQAKEEADRLRSLDCLTAAVYYEAATETLDGQRAVAQVVLNRVRHPAYPRTVCGVVFQGSERATGCQFTFTCDGALRRLPSEAGWRRAREVAEAALAGQVYKPVGYATHYHTNWVVPYWSSSLTKAANVGTHIFYRWEGGWGRPPAFRHRHAGEEPEIASIRHLSSVPPAAEANELAETLAEGVTSADMLAPVPPIDGTRAVVRRYEPLREQAAAAARAELSKPDVPQSLRWALTGDAANAPSPPAGKKAETNAADAQAKKQAPVAARAGDTSS